MVNPHRIYLWKLERDLAKGHAEVHPTFGNNGPTWAGKYAEAKKRKEELGGVADWRLVNG